MSRLSERVAGSLQTSRRIPAGSALLLCLGPRVNLLGGKFQRNERWKLPRSSPDTTQACKTQPKATRSSSAAKLLELHRRFSKKRLQYRDKRVDGPSPSEEMVSVVSCYSALVLKTIDIADIFTKILINGLLQIFNFDAALTSAFLVDSLGIRILFLWSGADMSASYVVWTPCSAVSTKTGSKPAGIVVVIYLLTSYFHYDIAYTPLLLGCPNEMLPYSLRSEGNAVELSAIYESFTITTFANPIGLEDIGRKYYIVSCCLPVVFFAVTLHLLPKTKGHSLEEIPVICDGLQAVEDFEDGPNSKGEKALVKGELHDRRWPVFS